MEQQWHLLRCQSWSLPFYRWQERLPSKMFSWSCFGLHAGLPLLQGKGFRIFFGGDLEKFSGFWPSASLRPVTNFRAFSALRKTRWADFLRMKITPASLAFLLRGGFCFRVFGRLHFVFVFLTGAVFLSSKFSFYDAIDLDLRILETNIKDGLLLLYRLSLLG